MKWVTHERPKTDHIALPWPTRHSVGAPREFLIGGGPRPWLRYLATLLRECRERGRQRRHLQMLDDRLLRDIGLTRADVELEVRKWSWME